ncbi:glycosyltransferase family protein [Sporosarcina cyprini]|uniref:glycosyltransferase family protein n=1 Tax=Sporosarcina cyprini TaxID=2910523 RepID=UPI00300C475F
MAIIQARMTSTRLPGKVMRAVMGKPLLEYQLEQVSQSRFIDQIVVATTRNSIDDIIVEQCNKLNIPTYRGSEDDVLARYFEAAERYKADIVVRLTSDCPLIDPEIIDQVISEYVRVKGKVDYISNTLKRTFPRGMDTEVFTFKALKTANEKAILTRDREHVSSYLYSHPDKFRLAGIESTEDYSKYRLTVDTIEDFNLIQLILEEIKTYKEYFCLRDILELFKKHEDWFDINSYIEQKEL